MNQEQKQAYEWAKNQNYQSVAARYAKILAGLIDEMNSPNELLKPDELYHMENGPIWVVDKVSGVREWCFWNTLTKKAVSCEHSPEYYDIDDYGKWIPYRCPPEGEEADT